MKWAFSLIKKGTPPLLCNLENLPHLAEIGNYAHASYAHPRLGSATIIVNPSAT